MQVTDVLALLAFASFASADCNQSGADYYDIDQALSIVDKACNNGLSATYGPESTYNGLKGVCMNSVNGKIDMLITHITEGDLFLSVDDCKDGLGKEVTGCDKGGETSYTNWKYKVDPNEGSC